MNKSQISPYLNFNGNCEEVMNFYQSVLGGELKIIRFAAFDGSAMPVSESQKDKVMHSALVNDTLSLMASDGMPDRKVIFGDSVRIMISGTDETRLTAFFNGLSEGGSVDMALEKQIWGDSFGMLTDRFGIHWMININSSVKANES